MPVLAACEKYNVKMDKIYGAVYRHKISHAEAFYNALDKIL